jgi:hypothetical protein
MDTSGANHRDRPRGGRGKFVRTTETAERDGSACRMRNLGHSYDEIAVALGFGDRGAARKAVERAMLLSVQEPAAEQRAMQMAKLDLLLRKAWEVLCARHIVVNQGRVVLDPSSGEPLTDHGPVLAAVASVLKIEERRAKLLGLDAPVRVEAVTVDMVDAEIARLVDEFRLPDPRSAL